MHTFSSRTVKTRNNRTALHFSCNLANYILGLEFGDHAKFQDQLKYKGLLKKKGTSVYEGFTQTEKKQQF